MQEENEKFTYTYCAVEQDEIRTIRQKYLSQEENKIEQLRKLDKSTTKSGTIIALLLGILGALLLGIGMCCTMVWADRFFAPGVVVGIVGMFVAALAYPIYQRITKKEREKLAPKIIALTNELIK